MCGISGIYNLQLKAKSEKLKAKSLKSKEETQKILQKMSQTLSHRGPDDEGFFVDEKIALAHRRLSIIDLTKAGHQPMIRGDLVIVFNGEIYNYIELKEELVAKKYKFQTQTDTEVILASYQEWGEKCLTHFNGMWAFAIYNTKTGNLFCARDRMGVKPFYYYADKGKFLFASEPKALLKHPSLKIEVDEQLVWDYLICGQLDHREETMFKGIKELRGGYFLTIQNKKIKIKNYWDLGKIELLNVSDQEASEKFREIFTDSVKLRLRADVAIGTCLSGGLDSSAIVCSVNRQLKEKGVEQIGSTQKTFSAVYNAKKYPNCDERKFIREVTRETKTSANYVFPDGKSLAKDLKKLIYTQDFPFGSTSIYAQYSVFRLAKSKKVKVILDGQGADEILAGYHTFFPLYFKSLKRQQKYATLIKEIIGYNKLHSQNFWPVLQRLVLPVGLFKNFSQKMGLNLKNAYYKAYYDYSVFNAAWRQKFTGLAFPKPNDDMFKDQSFVLARIQGMPSLLRYEDRNSMAFSIESRTPFLDYRLVEYVYNLRDDQKIRHGETKWIMRQALKGVLPEKIRTRQDKIGFATPEEIWFKKDLAPQMRQVFASKKFGSRTFWDQSRVMNSFDRFLAGEPIMYQLFWRIYNLELWLRRFID